ncbi:MAG: hypothetical protein Hals2KO_14760 [Halioglobus sp.]
MSNKEAEAKASGKNRRDILKAGIGALGAATLAPRVAGSASEIVDRKDDGSIASTSDGSEYDVIVVGGGFAGIAAARELRHAGLSVLILEARNRMGGRTFHVKRNGRSYELGGAWVHSNQPHVFSEVTRYGLALEDTTAGKDRERVVWWDGTSAREAGMSGFLPLAKMMACSSPSSGGGESDVPLETYQALAMANEQMEIFHAGADNAFPLPYDQFSGGSWRKADQMSIRDRLNEMQLSPEVSPILEGLLGASVHGNFSEASYAEMLRWWALSGSDFIHYGDSVSRYKFRDGTKSLVEAMIDDGRPVIKKGAAVSDVLDHGDHVEVVTAGGKKYRSRSAIVTVPMNVLASIRFSPELSPPKLAVSRERHAGAGIKFYIRTRQKIRPTLIFAGEREPISSMWTLADHGDGSTIVAFSTDPALIDPTNHSQVQQVLRRFIPGVDVLDTIHYDWHLDPYSLGTWCILKKGQMSNYLEALREPHGLVHFAGADIALGWRSMIDGAIGDGTQVANRVARILGARATPEKVSDNKIVAAVKTDDEALQSCTVCHTTDDSGAAGVGPNLRGKFGAPAASDSQFAYSEALNKSGISWDESTLDKFLTDPNGAVPGTTMGFQGVKSAEDRKAIIEAMKQLL